MEKKPWEEDYEEPEVAAQDGAKPWEQDYTIKPMSTFGQGDSWKSSMAGGFVRAMRDVPDAGAQLLTRGLEAITPGDFMTKERERVEEINRQAEEEYQTQWRKPGARTDYGRALGNIAATFAPAAAVTRTAGLAQAPLRAAGTAGAVGSVISQPVITPRDVPMTTEQFLAKKVEQAGVGAGAGMAGGYIFDKLGRIIFGPSTPAAAGQASATAAPTARAGATVSGAPSVSVAGGGSTLGKVTPDTTSLTAAQRSILQRGKQMGFKTTPGQESGSVALQQMEARMQSSPMFSGPFSAIKENNQRILNRAAANSIGENADELSSPVLARAAERIGSVFESVKDSAVRAFNPDEAAARIAQINADYEGVTTTAVIDNPLVKQVLKVAGSGQATGQQLGSISSKLGKRASKEMTAANGDRDLGEALFQIKEMVDDLMMEGMNATQKAELMVARQQYRNLMNLEHTGVVNPSSGNVSGLNLAGQLTRKDKSGFLRGGRSNELYDAARFAQAFKPIVGDSGTATRSMEVNPVTAVAMLPFNIAARAYTSAPVTAIARGATGPGVAPNLLTESQRQLLQKIMPITAGLGTTSLMNL